MIDLQLKGRVAIVTGGAQGIGYATAQRLQASGATVVLWDSEAARLQQALENEEKRLQPLLANLETK